MCRKVSLNFQKLLKLKVLFPLIGHYHNKKGLQSRQCRNLYKPRYLITIRFILFFLITSNKHACPPHFHSFSAGSFLFYFPFVVNCSASAALPHNHRNFSCLCSKSCKRKTSKSKDEMQPARRDFTVPLLVSFARKKEKQSQKLI